MGKFTKIHKQRISEAHKKGSYFHCLICNKQFWRKPVAIKKGDNKAAAVVMIGPTLGTASRRPARIANGTAYFRPKTK